MQNLQGIGNFFHGFQSRPLDPKDFCMEATGTPRQSVGFPGATLYPIKSGSRIKRQICGVEDLFPPDDLSSGPESQC